MSFNKYLNNWFINNLLNSLICPLSLVPIINHLEQIWGPTLGGGG